MKRSIPTGAALLWVAVTACTVSAPTTDDGADGRGDVVPSADAGGGKMAKKQQSEAGAEGGTSSAGDKCPYDGPPVDVSGFATCRAGGRCVPAGVVPQDQRSRLASCDVTGGGAGYCVPEKILAAMGVYLPKSCASLAGGEGRCVSTVFPDIDAQKASLPQDVCDDNERCAPCYDPIDGKATGACSSVPCDSPKKPAVVFGQCCQQNGTSRGRCLPTSMLPDSAKDGLDTRECKQGAELCVPAEQLDQAYVPPACKGSSLVGDYDGVCISTCVKQDFLTEIGTSQGDCKTGFFCAPCQNPLTGEPTGAPGCK